MNIFPANPDTFILERDPSTSPPTLIYTPVIGWLHVQGSMAFPITAMASGGMTHGKAIMHGVDGYITDPTHGLTFEDESEWMNYMKTAKVKSDPKAATKPEPEKEDDDDDRASVLDDEPESGVRPVVFGKKSYKSKSYWSMPADEIIFEIEGDDPYPNDARCEKIKREEYAKFKREGWTVGVPVFSPVEDDDDDAMDLV